jgi:tetratricopeptide (TPR) repeat protein
MTPKSFTPSSMPGYAYILTQPFVLLRYFGSFFLPIHLNADTDLHAFTELTPEALGGILFLLLLIAAIVLTARRIRLRPISYGLLWFLIASLPTSLYPLSEVENDHRMFMPFVGLALAVTWTAVLLMERITVKPARQPLFRTCMIAVFCLLMGTYAYGAHVRNRVWLNEETLWADDVQKSPQNGRGLMNYGLALMGKGDYRNALDYFQRAILYTPNYSTLEINLGVVNGALNNGNAAEPHFLRAIALAPENDEPHLYYGRWLFQEARISEAVQQFEMAARINPSQITARELLIQAYSLSGNTPAALKLAQETRSIAPTSSIAALYLANRSALDVDNWINISLKRYQHQDYAGSLAAAQEARKLNPQSFIAYNNIGAAYAGMGQWQQAVENEKQALAIRPDYQLAKNNLAFYQSQLSGGTSQTATPEQLLNQSLLLNRAGRYKESIAAAQAALKLRPGYAEAWNNVAAGYQSLGFWDKAIAAAREAVRLKPDFQLAKNNLAWALAQKNKQASSDTKTR